MNMSLIATLIIWINLLLPAIVSFFVLSSYEAIVIFCIEISTILIVYRFPIGIFKSVMSILSVLAPINVWYMLTFHSSLNSETIQFCLTMPFNAYSEFLLSVMDSRVFLIAILVSGILGFICWQKIFLPKASKTIQSMFAIGLLFLSVSVVDYNIIAPRIPRPPLMAMNIVESTFPLNIFSAIVVKYLPLVHAETEPAAIAVKVSREDEMDKETVVYVIGESARADHWHKNGYSRETTPFIDSDNNVINFPNVRSISDCTSLSVPGLFAMLSAEQLYELDPKCRDRAGFIQGTLGHVTLFDYFRNAGFFTSAIINSNQSILPIKSVGAKIDHVELTSEETSQYDTQMLPSFYKELERPFKKKFIVLHIYGSHWQYISRYPPQFNKFKVSTPQLSEHMAYYDNSILATDSFLHDVISKLELIQGKVVLVYTSDHGEGDGNKMEVHCSVPTNHTTLVPLFFWTKGKISSGKLQLLKANTSKYVSHELVATTLLDLVGINSDKLDFSHALTRRMSTATVYYTYGYNRKLYSCSLDKCAEVN